MQESVKFIEPWHVYGDGVIRLDFHRTMSYGWDETIYDKIRQNFRDAFRRRDYHFGEPDFGRFVGKNGVVSIHFKLSELGETFLYDHSPEEMARFLDKYLVDETDQSDALVSRIRQIENNNRIIFGEYNNERKPACWYFHPFNFPAEELGDILHRQIGKFPFTERRVPRKRPLGGRLRTDEKARYIEPMIASKTDLKKMRNKLLEIEKPILLALPCGEIIPPEEIDEDENL